MITADGLVVDLFAGAGGASMALAAALGRQPDIAINHDPVALAVHRKNHPKTKHIETDICEVDPVEVTGGKPVAVLWASPDCKDHSNAKGGQPRDHKIRSLAWVVVEWAKKVRPTVIFVENVREFQGWGPLDEHGKRIPERVGETYLEWFMALVALGYNVETRVLDASAYGSPTKRKRFFLVARCDGEPIVWPEPSHGPRGSGLLPLHTAAECIDWSLPVKSIFERKKPLAEKTLWRIAQGLKRYVFDAADPFIVKVNHGKREWRGQSIREPLTTITAGQRGHGLVVPELVPAESFMVRMAHGEVGKNGTKRRGHGHGSLREPLPTITASSGGGGFGLATPVLLQSGYGERKGQRARFLNLQEPLGTLVNGQKHALVSAFLTKYFGDPLRQDDGGGKVVGKDMRDPMSTITVRDHHAVIASTLVKLRGQCHSAPLNAPMPTVTARGNHIGEVRAFLTAYYKNDGTGGQDLHDPLRTITTKHRLGLVTVHGVDYQIVDIGLRMLEPEELKRAQFGTFAHLYDLSIAKTKKNKIRLLGNSVPPEPALKIVAANRPKTWMKEAA